MEILLYRRDVDLLAGPAAIGVRRGMQRLMNVADEMDQKREVAGRTPFVIIPVAKATRVFIDFCVTQFPCGHRFGKSSSLFCMQISMKCHDAVYLSSLQNSVSGRIEAAAIAFSTESVCAGTPRICATC